MIKVKIILFLLLLTPLCFAQPPISYVNPPLNIKDDDDDIFPYEITFAGDPVTDDGDETATINLWSPTDDIDIHDDTPHLSFRDTDDDTAYMFHLDTASAAAPYNPFALHRGTDDGTGFSVTDTLMYFDNSNDVYFLTNTDTTGSGTFGSLNVSGNITLGDDNWIGLGASTERFHFGGDEYITMFDSFQLELESAEVDEDGELIDSPFFVLTGHYDADATREISDVAINATLRNIVDVGGAAPTHHLGIGLQGATIANFYSVGTTGTYEDISLALGEGLRAAGVIEAESGVFEEDVFAVGKMYAEDFVTLGPSITSLGDSTSELDIRRTLSSLAKTGTGSGTMGAGGDCTQASDLNYKVEIDLAGELKTATFKWSDDGGSSWDAEDVLTERSFLDLNNGVQVWFKSASGTDFDLGDYWTWTAIGTDNQVQALIVDSTNSRVGIGTSAPWQELTIAGDQTISDANPNLTFRDSDDDTAYQWHCETNTASAPWNNFSLWRGTDDGTGFSVNPSTPLMYFDNNNNFAIPTGNFQVDTTGRIHIGNGSLSAPSLAFLNDTDTGIYRPSNNTLALVAGGVAFWSGQATSNLFFQNIILDKDGTLVSPAISWDLDLDTGIYHPEGGDSNLLGFITDTTERMRIDSQGNVGIGTTAPASELDVNGEVKAEKLAIETNALFTNSGHTGIGTNNPSKLLSIVSTGTPADDDVYFFYDPSAAGGNPDVGDAVDAPSVYIYRRAAEGDSYLRQYVDKFRKGIIYSSYNLILYGAGSLALQSDASSTISYNDIHYDSDTRGTRFGASDDWKTWSDGTDLKLDRVVGSGQIVGEGGFQLLGTARFRAGTGTSNVIDMYHSTNGIIQVNSGNLLLGCGVGSDIGLTSVGGNVKLYSPTQIGDGGTTNYLDISATGDTTFVGSAGLPFGEIYANDVADTLTITASGQANKVQITSFAVDGVSNNATPDHTNDHITITKAGMYLCTVSMSISSAGGGGADDIGFAVYKNNGATEFANLHGHRKLAGGGGDRGSCTMSGIIDLAVNDTIEVWIWNEDSTDNLVVDDITLSLCQIGGT